MIVTVVLLAALVSSAVLLVAFLNPPSEPSLDELSGISVAVYFDRGNTAASREAVIARSGQPFGPGA